MVFPRARLAIALSAPPDRSTAAGRRPARPPETRRDHPMNTVISADGTTIAFDQYGDGPPIVMTQGAFNTRATTEPLAKALAPQFTVLNYDRRGRGDSGD